MIQKNLQQVKINVVDVGFNSLFLKALKDLDFLLGCIGKKFFVKKVYYFK